MAHYSHREDMSAIVQSYDDDIAWHFEPKHNESTHNRAKTMLRHFLQTYDESQDKVTSTYSWVKQPTAMQVTADIDDSDGARKRAM